MYPIWAVVFEAKTERGLKRYESRGLAPDAETAVAVARDWHAAGQNDSEGVLRLEKVERVGHVQWSAE